MEDQIIGRLVNVHCDAPEGLVEDVPQLCRDGQTFRVGPGIEGRSQFRQPLPLLAGEDGTSGRLRPSGQPVEGHPVIGMAGQDQRGLDQQRERHQRQRQPAPSICAPSSGSSTPPLDPPQLWGGSGRGEQSDQPTCPGDYASRRQHVQRQQCREDVAGHLLGRQAHPGQEEDGVGQEQEGIHPGFREPPAAQQMGRPQHRRHDQEGQFHFTGAEQQRHYVEERARVLP